MDELTDVVVQAEPLWRTALFIILGGMVAGSLGLIGGFILHWWRDRRNRRKEHLQQLQEHVLNPLKVNAEHHSLQLSVLLTGISNVALETRNVRVASASSTEPLTTPQSQLVVKSTLAQWPQEPYSHALYQCAKETHFKDAIGEYERLESEVEQFDLRCLEYVQSLASQIENAMGLPLRSESVTHGWINRNALALHIYERQQGCKILLNPKKLSDSEDGYEVGSTNGSQILYLYRVSKAQATMASDLATKLEQDVDRFQDLVSNARALSSRAYGLGIKLERLLHISKLQGKCDLL